MLDQLSPALRARTAPVVEKWDGFLLKVGARVDEAFAEADAGLDEIIAAHSTDPGPLGAAFSALQARFRGLQTKVSEAWEKIDHELDAIRDDAEGRDLEVLARLWSTMSRKHRDTRFEIDLRYERCVIQKEADLARALQAQGERERGTPVRCSHCGAELNVATWWQASNVTCEACKAVNSVSPGPALIYFFQGNGAHALVREATQDTIFAWMNAERDYKALRVPTSDDYARFLDATRAMWSAYYTGLGRTTPSFSGDVGAAVEAKLSHYAHWDMGAEKKAREANGRMLALAIAGDRAGLAAHVRATGLDLGECLYAAAERGQWGAAEALLELKHAEDGGGDPKGAWIAKEKRDLERWLGTRG